MAEAGLVWLEANHETVNNLNVFPVPDGDTGTNMLLTMRSAYDEVANVDEAHAGRVAQKLYNGALMGARGNSGVILSQLWRGLATILKDHPDFDADMLARAMAESARIAYGAVQEPVEGTMLTVARETSEAVTGYVEGNSGDMMSLMITAVDAAHASVQRTPDLLPVLKEAGVVDSGGMGIYYVVEGMLRRLKGEELALDPAAMASRSLQSELRPIDELGYGYDVQFLIKGQALDVVKVRADIEAMGDSGLIVGDENLIKVHIHVHDPGIPVSYGANLGILLDVVVENMQEQYEDFIVERGGKETESVAAPEIAPGQVAVVTIAPSTELGNIFYSLGAALVISGGQTMNPSTKDILDGINTLNTSKVVVMPNNKNIFMAAEKAAEATAELEGDRQVVVIPTRTVPQGIAAMFALDPEGMLEDVAEAMQEAMSLVETGEVTTAVRDATIDGVEVKEGQVIGLKNGKLVTSGEDINTVVIDLLGKMDASDYELITLYHGNTLNYQDAEVLAEHLQEEYPDLEVELAVGGQPHYHYIISIE